MAGNRVSVRVDAPGAKEAATDIGMLGTKLKGLGSSGTIGGFNKTLGALGLGAIGASAALGTLTDLGGKVSAFLGDSMSKANDFNETLNKSKVIFGDNSTAVEKWAEGMADRFGQSKGDALDLASTFAGLFSTVGVSLDDATGMSMKLTELGGDLASFFNTDVQSALEAVRSGLAGESEPLRKFNVFLSETAVAAKAAEMGMKGVNGKLTEGEKVQARYAIIMEQTAVAQGDFANTSDSAANAARRFDAALENTQVTIGQKFTPMLTDMSNVMVDDVMPAMQELVGLLTGTTDTSNTFLRPTLEALAQLPGAAGDAARSALEAFEEAEWAETAGRAADGMRLNFLSHGPKWNSAVTFMSREMQGAFALDFRQETDDAMNGISDTIRGNKDTVQQAMEDFLFYMNNPLKREKEIARVEGELTSQRLIDGLNSNDDGIRNAAQDYQAILQGQYTKLTGHAYTAGSMIANALERGIKTFDVPKGLIASSMFGYGGIRVGGGGKKKKKRASGGPVASGEAYIVGEDGPEMLQMGSRSGNIVPNNRLRGGGGGQRVNVQISLSTREFSRHSQHYATINRGGPSF